jgi:putative endonuclease
MASHNELGKRGEEIAVANLNEKGFKILAQTYRYKRAEVDIIAQCDQVVIFVEVKTRSSTFDLPEKAVNIKKQNLLMDAANHYIFENKLTCSIRFDIISILIINEKIKIYHIEDAFFGYVN